VERNANLREPWNPSVPDRYVMYPRNCYGAARKDPDTIARATWLQGKLASDNDVCRTNYRRIHAAALSIVHGITFKDGLALAGRVPRLQSLDGVEGPRSTPGC